jgi:peptidoglycan hydrolase-like protein with peptidoglycan-binding domain
MQRPISTSSQGIPTIKKNSQGLSVAYCQNLINSRLPTPPLLWVDGIFGQKTDVKVRQYQQRKFLAADGIVGPLTWVALESGPPAIRKRPTSGMAGGGTQGGQGGGTSGGQTWAG